MKWKNEFFFIGIRKSYVPCNFFHMKVFIKGKFFCGDTKVLTQVLKQIAMKCYDKYHI